MRTWLGVLLGGIAACANQVIVDDVADDGGGSPDATINKDASPKDGGTDSGTDTDGGIDAGEDAGVDEDAGDDDGGTIIIDAGSLDGSPCPPCLVKGYVCCANAKSKNYGTCQSSTCLSCCM